MNSRQAEASERNLVFYFLKIVDFECIKRFFINWDLVGADYQGLNQKVEGFSL
jgi:hypothetical protein